MHDGIIALPCLRSGKGDQRLETPEDSTCATVFVLANGRPGVSESVYGVRVNSGGLRGVGLHVDDLVPVQMRDGWFENTAFEQGRT